MRFLLMALASALVCVACAPANGGAGNAVGGHVEMYGTVDTGVTVHD